MQDRSPKVESEESSRSAAQLFGLAALRIATVGSGTALALLIPDLVLHRSQASSPSSDPSAVSKAPAAPKKFHQSFHTAGMLATSRALFRTYTASAQTSIVKSISVQQKDRLAEALRSDELEERTSTHSSLPQAMLVSLVIGGADTSITQHSRNIRTWNMEHVRNPAFVIPVPKTMGERGKTFTIGYAPRFTANVVSVAGLLLMSPLTASLNAYFPEMPNLSLIGATSASAVTVGVITNSLGVLYTNQAIRTCPETFSAPSGVSVAKDLIKKEGIKAMFRGYPASIGYTAIAYFTIPYMEKVADNVVVPAAVKLANASTKLALSSARHSFFSQPTAASALSAATPGSAQESKSSSHDNVIQLMMRAP